jgi:hypothetical protein
VWPTVVAQTLPDRGTPQRHSADSGGAHHRRSRQTRPGLHALRGARSARGSARPGASGGKRGLRRCSVGVPGVERSRCMTGQSPPETSGARQDPSCACRVPSTCRPVACKAPRRDACPQCTQITSILSNHVISLLRVKLSPVMWTLLQYRPIARTAYTKTQSTNQCEVHVVLGSFWTVMTALRAAYDHQVHDRPRRLCG